MQSEKGVDNNNSALFRMLDLDRATGVGARLAGVVSALSAALDGPSFRGVGTLVLAALLAGCAQAPTPTAHSRYHGKEHFAEGGYYGKASPRMVGDGDSIPRGGGQYLVGRPYTIAGRTYYPAENEHYVGQGIASWYGDAFHGRKTANGEIYDKNALSAAHPTMPLPSYARVTNLTNGYSVIVRVNDRGPYAAGRVMDVSSRVADVLDFKRMGTARVKVEYVGRAPMEGSNDNELLASLKTDGGAADLSGGGALVAEVTSPVVAMFGAKSEPPPEAETPPPPRARRPERAAPRVERVAPDDEIRVAEVEETTAAPRSPAPLPPTRPYDLGGVREASAIPKPPLRGSEKRALYFTPTRPTHVDPLAKLLRRGKAHSLLDEDDDVR